MVSSYDCTLIKIRARGILSASMGISMINITIPTNTFRSVGRPAGGQITSPGDSVGIDM